MSVSEICVRSKGWAKIPPPFLFSKLNGIFSILPYFSFSLHPFGSCHPKNSQDIVQNLFCPSDEAETSLT